MKLKILICENYSIEELPYVNFENKQNLKRLYREFKLKPEKIKFYSSIANKSLLKAIEDYVINNNMKNVEVDDLLLRNITNNKTFEHINVYDMSLLPVSKTFSAVMARLDAIYNQPLESNYSIFNNINNIIKNLNKKFLNNKKLELISQKINLIINNTISTIEKKLDSKNFLNSIVEDLLSFLDNKIINKNNRRIIINNIRNKIILNKNYKIGTPENIDKFNKYNLLFDYYYNRFYIKLKNIDRQKHINHNLLDASRNAYLSDLHNLMVNYNQHRDSIKNRETIDELITQLKQKLPYINFSEEIPNKKKDLYKDLKIDTNSLHQVLYYIQYDKISTIDNKLIKYLVDVLNYIKDNKNEEMENLFFEIINKNDDFLGFLDQENLCHVINILKNYYDKLSDENKCIVDNNRYNNDISKNIDSMNDQNDVAEYLLGLKTSLWDIKDIVWSKIDKINLLKYAIQRCALQFKKSIKSNNRYSIDDPKYLFIFKNLEFKTTNVKLHTILAKVFDNIYSMKYLLNLDEKYRSVLYDVLKRSKNSEFLELLDGNNPSDYKFIIEMISNGNESFIRKLKQTEFMQYIGIINSIGHDELSELKQKLLKEYNLDVLQKKALGRIIENFKKLNIDKKKISEIKSKIKEITSKRNLTTKDLKSLFGDIIPDNYPDIELNCKDVDKFISEFGFKKDSILEDVIIKPFSYRAYKENVSKNKYYGDDVKKDNFIEYFRIKFAYDNDDINPEMFKHFDYHSHLIKNFIGWCACYGRMINNKKALVIWEIQSDLMQGTPQISKLKLTEKYKVSRSKIENTFEDWYLVFVNEAIKYAKKKNYEYLCIEKINREDLAFYNKLYILLNMDPFPEKSVVNPQSSKELMIKSL